MTEPATTAGRRAVSLARRWLWRSWMLVRFPAEGGRWGVLSTLGMLLLAGVLVFAASSLLVAPAGVLVIAVRSGDVPVAWRFVAAGLAVLLGSMLLRGARRLLASSRRTAVALRVGDALTSFAHEWRNAETAWVHRHRPVPTAPIRRARVQSPGLKPRRRAAPLVGYRAWSIALADVAAGSWTPVLVGPVTQAPWHTSELHAECRPGWPALDGSGGHDRIPEVGCGCGIYALKVPPSHLSLLRRGKGELAVVGAVEMVGRVLEGELGYRAERARIVGPLELDPVRCRVPTCRQRVVAMDLVRAVPLCEEHAYLAREPWAGPVPIGEFLPMLQARLELRYGVEVIMNRGEKWT